MITRRRALRRLGPLVLVLVSASGCAGDPGPTADGGAPVVATTTIWADVASNVLCDESGPVGSIMPEGADPHAFEPSFADRARLESASLVVSNGLGLEEGLVATLEQVVAAGTPVFEMSATVEATRVDDSDDHEEHSDGDGHSESGDPHIWFDPVLVSAALPELGRAVVEATGRSESQVVACVREYQAELAALDAEIAALLDPIPVEARRLVTNHDSLGYFADRYDLEVVGTIFPSSSTLAGTSPAALEELAELIESNDVRTVFAEEQLPDADVRALAARVDGLEVVALATATLGPTGRGAETYLDFMRTTAERIAAGLRR